MTIDNIDVQTVLDLISELQWLVERCDTTALEDGSSIDTSSAHALLRQLVPEQYPAEAAEYAS